MPPPVQILSIFDSSEKDDSRKSVAEDEDEEREDDEEALVHWNQHSQQQHLQGRLQT